VVQSGDQDARWDWPALARRARSEAGRTLRSPHDVEDAVQEALVRAWRHRGRGSAIDSPEAWMTRVARNEALRVLERTGARARREQPIGDVEPSHDEAGHGVCEDRVDLRRALRPLSTGDRTLVGLRYVADMTQPEVARVLGVPEGTVKVRLHRIRRRLADELGEAA
jgi:RNA polymerase sigma-70 factor (ECF subfamily)